MVVALYYDESATSRICFCWLDPRTLSLAIRIGGHTKLVITALSSQRVSPARSHERGGFFVILTNRKLAFHVSHHCSSTENDPHERHISKMQMRQLFSLLSHTVKILLLVNSFVTERAHTAVCL